MSETRSGSDLLIVDNSDVRWNIASYLRVWCDISKRIDLSGPHRVDRADTCRLFTRWIYFRRTGKSIEEAARSLINGLIRDGRLESDGSRMRRCK